MNQGSMSGFITYFYRFGDYFMVLLYVNLLWICFTLLGGIIFGWAPSTTAMFAVLRKRIMEKNEPIFSEFWKVYRQEFLRTNGLGFIALVVAYILAVNIQYFAVETAWLFVAVRYMIIAIMIITAIMLLYVFPLLVHYETTLYNHIKNSLFLTIYQPIRTVVTVGLCLLVVQILAIFPVFIPFFGVSLFAFVVMWTTYYTFRHVERRQKEIQAELENQEA
ncbi:YesL family protein [Halalkalibacter sp. APA_J-10(15)]|uniref:YesL family protein n=1 Tax=Halalkalibacter sp. APA_J-10(15) TaxID=2933805 RepID=UPI001FF4FB2E|nr:YesL family protein [Halalkalibacter sp. APA_J-10(15)]MCK0473590.1 YesL family protein [Halalkalibacter sp. APA_J-10(15)]